MKDTYAEWLVKRKTPVYAVILKPVIIVAVAIIFLMGLINALFMILALALGFGAYLLFLTWKVEYEYIFVTNELLIDRIQSQTRRKTVKKVEMDNVELMAPSSSHLLDSYNNNPNYRTQDYSSNMEGALTYTIIYSKDGKNERIIFEPDIKIVKAMYSVSPRAVNME